MLIYLLFVLLVQDVSLSAWEVADLRPAACAGSLWRLFSILFASSGFIYSYIFWMRAYVSQLIFPWGWEMFCSNWANLNNFLTFYPYKLKFEILLDILKIQSLAVLFCQHFNFLAGKWRHTMDLKFSIFIFVHLFGSDERRPWTNIKPKKVSKYLISIKRYNCYNVQNLLLKIEFMQISLYYISGLNQGIEELFSVLSLFQDRLSATDIKSKIYILKFHFKSVTSFSR